MKSTVEAVRSAGLTAIKIMVGGAPVTQDYANEIGADGYSPDAASAVDLALQLAATC
jgi:5-methyltetrahydrofolate--homocysteine methyltransferase